MSNFVEAVHEIGPWGLAVIRPAEYACQGVPKESGV